MIVLWTFTMLDAQNARGESDRAVFEAILKTMSSDMELYTAFQDDISDYEWSG